MSLSSASKKITVPAIRAMKSKGEKISMLTAYDALMAEIVDQAGVDMILVGDSAGMVMGGRPNTLSVTMDEMLHYTRSVSNAVAHALLVADMPFLSYQVSVEQALTNAGRFLQEAGAEAVKLEGGQSMAGTIRRLTGTGIPVMGHIGLTPQSMHQLGGFKVQGREASRSEELRQDALALQEAGVFCIVLEKIPAALATDISQSLSIPTIGIGAGPGCDGQVLVTHDMLGLFRRFRPRFVRRYAELGDAMEKAVQAYIKDVKANTFPDESESY
ncbi:MAG: 3-methyl-2-oxobutanoate hydroxymethyltransferase [Calditrichaeota bacterium]|nr:MAG: 3-methyl-2-oxobutanoate hydroxymethyltransferase [Calditrichota bacterium]